MFFGRSGDVRVDNTMKMESLIDRCAAAEKEHSFEVIGKVVEKAVVLTMRCSVCNALCCYDVRENRIMLETLKVYKCDRLYWTEK